MVEVVGARCSGQASATRGSAIEIAARVASALSGAPVTATEVTANRLA